MCRVIGCTARASFLYRPFLKHLPTVSDHQALSWAYSHWAGDLFRYTGFERASDFPENQKGTSDINLSAKGQDFRSCEVRRAMSTPITEQEENAAEGKFTEGKPSCIIAFL